MDELRQIQTSYKAQQAYLKRRYGKQIKAFKAYVGTKQFGLGYVIFSLVILLGTTIVWSILSARIQQGNADQLVDGYMFASPATFAGADFPSQHTFLLKWPLFYLLKLLHYTPNAFLAVTVILSVVTVGLLVALLYKLERRPLVFATLCLALASTLFLIPAQPYAGGILPVNMAMITTRNIEYIMYIACLGLLARMPRFRTYRFWFAVSGLALVVASDRLFLDIAVGGAFLAIIVYALNRRWNLVTLSINWLVAVGAAGAIALTGLWVLKVGEYTNIVNASAASPYAAIHGIKNVVIAVIYLVTNLFTNFGANPAYDGITLKQLPSQAFHRLLSFSGISYVVNAAVLVYGLSICYRFLKASVLAKRVKNVKPNTPFRLSTMLIWSSLAAGASFVATNHYYAVDGRYLGICFFTIFVALASYVSKRRWPAGRLLTVGLILLVGIGFAVPGVISSYRSQQAALTPENNHNNAVAQALINHPVAALVGDYWRVLPIKLASHNKVNVIPLQTCTQPRTVLTSKNWEINLHQHSFAYLVTFNSSLTGFPHCNLQQVTSAYGRPNSSTLIAGSLAHPSELLLFYDKGIQNSALNKTLSSAPATILPINLDELPYTSCNVPTDMNIVAHQDDDLLFMNPDVQQDITAGHCIRTVYVTAGDAGADTSYWLAREQGSEAAYSQMLGSKSGDDLWIERIVKLADNEYITVANPRGNSSISLIFMRLPDGNLQGDGFADSHNESLAKLASGKINTIHAIDGQSSYTSVNLTAALTSLLNIYQPALIRTQADYVSKEYPDHSDHITVGHYVQTAYAQYEQQQYQGQVSVPIRYYIGYPIHGFPQNISGQDLADKEAAFLAYAKFDGGVCHSIEQCQQTAVYNAYLGREYQNPE